MRYYAHSPKGDVPAQPYEDHIIWVWECAGTYADAVRRYAIYPRRGGEPKRDNNLSPDGELLCSIINSAAPFHDLGKLGKENQAVLSGAKSGRSLPCNHVDAGTAHFLSDQHLSVFAAAVVYAHHVGFSDFTDEQNREGAIFRDAKIMDATDRELPEFEKIHHSLVQLKYPPGNAGNSTPAGDRSVFLRLALSCLVDADHTDTATNYKKLLGDLPPVLLRPAERLKRLNKYVAGLKKDDSARTLLREEMYAACRDADVSSHISSCDSPVGSGKTTAVMAHLLQQASNRNLRRIFVILPFTNIITQSVKRYREALILPGERPEDVVAELHHRADFENEDARHLTALWTAPVIVTTAVAFFETLASNSPSTLRRLHQLPGSAIFMDESHAALPARLLPVAWRWINTYANEWGCYWLLASGSLSRFWTIEEIAHATPGVEIPEIVNDGLRTRLAKYEKQRVTYKKDLVPKSISELANWVNSCPGPRLVILNTVQNAALLADHLCKQFGRDRVEHLSTALTPADREQTLECIKKRLASPEDTDWTLVATSCVEAGVDFSFRTGFRELASLVSLLQAGGRINREGLYKYAEMWSFCLALGNGVNSNTGLQDSATVLREYFEKNIEIQPALSTKSIAGEIKLGGLSTTDDKTLVSNEKLQNFPFVEKNFKVIQTNTRITVVDAKIAEKIKSHKIDWRELQNNSVQIAKHQLDKMRTPEILEGIYHWNRKYDDFLGYMAGIVEQLELEKKK